MSTYDARAALRRFDPRGAFRTARPNDRAQTRWLVDRVLVHERHQAERRYRMLSVNPW